MIVTSLSDLKGVLGTLLVSGTWSEEQSHLPFNILKLWIICLSLQHWIIKLEDNPLQILSNDAIVVASINHQGGTRRLAMAEDWLLSWSEVKIPALSTVCIPGIHK